MAVYVLAEQLVKARAAERGIGNVSHTSDGDIYRCQYCGQPAEDVEDFMHRGCRLRAAFAEDAKDIGVGLLAFDMVSSRQKLGLHDPCPDCRVDLLQTEKGPSGVGHTIQIECRVRPCRLHQAAPELLAACKSLLAYVEDYCDEGPEGEGWKSD